MYTEWQPYWAGGFGNLGDIAEAVIEVKNTTQPIADTVPQLLAQMELMNRTMESMQDSVQHMNTAVNGINTSVYGMSYSIPRRMDTIRNQMSPWNMMNLFR